MEGVPGQLEAGIRYLRETTESVQRMPGWKGGYVLVDRQSGNVMTMTLWKTEADRQASAEAAAKLREQAGQRAGATGSPAVEMYEVVLHI